MSSVGVIGAGQMGAGIAQVSAQAGYKVFLADVSQELAEKAKAGIANVKLETNEGRPAIGLDLNRSGSRSTFGEVRVLKAGVKDPVAQARGIAVYTEIGTRHVSIPLGEAAKGGVTGPVTVQYVETFADGAKVIAETQTVLR